MLNPVNKMKFIRPYIKSIRSINRRKKEAYDSQFELTEITDHVLKVSSSIRGNHPPAIIIHGVMPRSGTVYTGELLRLHPDIYAYPNELWEIPFMELTGDIKNLQQLFFDRFKGNRERMGEVDFLPLFGASLMAYLYSFVPEGKKLLIKIPDVQFLQYFPIVFPNEHLLLLMRDGRDLVSSTTRTWPEEKFSNVCKEWKNSAQHMVAFDHFYHDKRDDYQFMKYEDIVDNPEEFVRNSCQWYGLDVERFPFEQITELAFRGSSTLQPEGEVNWEPIKSNKSTKTVGHWHQWSAKQTKQFKDIAGAALINAGYCEDLNW